MKIIPKKILFCHFSASGNKDAVTYLQEKIEKFGYLVLAFHHVPEGESVYSTFEKGEKTGEWKFKALHPPKKNIMVLMPIIYLIHLINILRLFFLIKEPYDIFIGQNYFCALGGIILKHFGKVKTVIYWVGDYFPIPPSGPYRYYLRFFYVIDRFCLKYVDKVWFMTPRLWDIRKKENRLPLREKGVYKVVSSPIAVNRKNILNPKTGKTAVFLGVLSENQGVQEIIKIIPKLIKKIPDFNFNIIGSGVYENTLKQLVNDLKLNKCVHFKGFVSTEEEVKKIVSSASVAISLYKPDKYSFTQFADSGKIKMYLSCGVPVITTSVPFISKEVEESRGGMVVEYGSAKIIDILIKILSDTKTNQEFRENALKIALKYTPENIFRNAFT